MALLLLIFHAVPIAVHKKKHAYERRRGEGCFYSYNVVYCHRPYQQRHINLNYVDAFKRCTYVLALYETELNGFASLVAHEKRLKGIKAEKGQLKEKRLVNAR